MNHPDPQEEIPNQEVTIDQDQVLIQDQGPIGQDPIATIGPVTGIRKQGQKVYINATSMEKKPKTTQQ